MTYTVTVLRKIDLPQAIISLLADRIIHVHFKKHAVLDVSLQLELRKHYKELMGGTALRFIFSADDGFVFTREARERAKEFEQTQAPRNCALIVNNLSYRIVANFYIRVMKPKGNYRLFNSVLDALPWLRTRPD